MTNGQLREAIIAAGGLLTQADMAERWGISKAAVSEYVKREDFPSPLAGRIGRSHVWIGNEVDAWRETPRRAGRPKGELMT